MKKLLPVIILLLVSTAYAQFAKVGTVGAKFMDIPVGPRAVGMGGAFNAIGDDASSCFWNPALLVRVAGKEAFLTQTLLYADINCLSGAYVQNLGIKGTIGVFYTYVDVGPMKRTTPEDPDGTLGEFNYTPMVGGISYARMLTDKFAFGVNLKGVYENFDVEKIKATGVALDLGTLYYTGLRSLRMGMSLLHFGPDMTPTGSFKEFSGDAPEELKEIDEKFMPYAMPLTFRLGFAMEVLETENSRLTAAIDWLHPSDNLERGSFGLEYFFNEMLYLRTGYETFRDDKGGISGGCGIVVGGLKVDYSFTDHGYLPDVHRISVGFAP